MLSYDPFHFYFLLFLKIITANQDPNIVLQNVPQEMATEIPRVFLTFSGGPVELQNIVQKTWSQDQVPVTVVLTDSLFLRSLFPTPMHVLSVLHV